MSLYIKVGSITNAQRSQRALRQSGYKSIIKKIENPSKEDGCGYIVVSTHTRKNLFLSCKKREYRLEVLTENDIP